MAEDSDEMLATLRWRSENFPGQTHGADLVSAWALGEIEQLRSDHAEQAETIERLRRELEETHEIIKDDVATQEALRLRGALLMIRDGFIPQGMSPALFSEKVLVEVPAIETDPAIPVSR